MFFMKNLKKAFTVLLFVLVLACVNQKETEGIPQGILDIIELMEDPNYIGELDCTNQIWEYSLNGDKVYYFDSGLCMDANTHLFDVNGNLIGTCGGWGPCDSIFVDFYENRSEGECVWTRP